MVRKKKNRKVRNRRGATPLAEVNERKWVRPGLFAVVLVVALSVMSWGVITLLDAETLPIRSVKLEGDFRYMKEKDLQQVIKPYAKGGFFTVDIDQLQKAVRSSAWVDDVSVRRVWPDTLKIKIREQKPMARWGDDGLVNVRGERFEAEQSAVTELPVLYGPNGYEQALTKRYIEIGELLEPVELKIAGLYVDQRRSWRVRLTNNIELKLGRTSVIPRLARFVRTYLQVLAQKTASMNTVDLRYTNGFAVQFRAEDIARISRHPSTADVNLPAVMGRTPSSQFDLVSATFSLSSSPCAPSQRHLDGLATNGGEKCGLGSMHKRIIKKGTPPGVLRGVESNV